MAFVGAAARGTKSYLRKDNYRDIAVGYAAADVLSSRCDLADYLNCGDRPFDFLGINLFSWCGDSS
jgi:Glucanosyltransferase